MGSDLQRYFKSASQGEFDIAYRYFTFIEKNVNA